MIRVKVYIAFYKRAITIALPDDVQPVEQLIPALRNKLYLPWIKYSLSFPEKKGLVPPKKTLRELGIHDDDTLIFDIERPNSPESEEDNLVPTQAEPENPAPPSQRNGMPLWISILLVLLLVAICVGVLLLLRSWEIYS